MYKVDWGVPCLTMHLIVFARLLQRIETLRATITGAQLATAVEAVGTLV